ncbi:hypothetical protein [Marinomonas aquiplantarum]|uniref:Uncharacterized protein n=1 Tax=Marinomonas aquiplantarum TaxID=491951 RepID=A0A366D3M7_9GAMM|nr:hypothetical protein [Marinomonas aquiplantarum]RBO84099.1 hypothetical protein DFP76_103373 [Marinomonas aquiplantarum]
MKSAVTSLVASLCLALMSSMVLAHPGHDHAHWSSELIHMLTWLAIASVIVGGLIYKQVLRRKGSKQEDKNHDA